MSSLICLAALYAAAIPQLELSNQGWQTDYARAMAQARSEHRMLLVYFSQGAEDAAAQRFEKVLQTAAVRSALNPYVCVRVPVDGQVRIGGKSQVLLKHAAFREMLGRPGIAIIDLANAKERYYGQVVSAFPFDPGHCYKAPAMKVMLGLPQGSLTQRTMIFAVRIHPEAPASTQGEFNPVLASEAESHSRRQARIRLQGHHDWESRFHQINARLSGDASGTQEVVAESWPGETLVEAAMECVDSWRHSPGHWSAVRSRHRAFGYDMKRGSNGVWYATGIFARLSRWR